mmetsp:Transcript_4710/g.5652  ORF Transcript_4710/g.5652 Transcript_4710/m.5652 type:complete len:96 (+) Transcript_4710:288-575(+)
MILFFPMMIMHMPETTHKLQMKRTTVVYMLLASTVVCTTSKLNNNNRHPTKLRNNTTQKPTANTQSQMNHRLIDGHSRIQQGCQSARGNDRSFLE